MDGILFALTLATALASIVMGGVFYGFTVLVMKGLRTVPAAHGVGVMQSVNRAAYTPAFMGVFMGAALLSLALGVWAVRDWDGTSSAYLVAGAAVYLVGSFMVTAGYHVPRNTALDQVTAGTPEADRLWERYLREWTGMNTVRGLLAILAGALMIAGVFTAS
ncbi:anthrone oxygenase family protein [Yinghuangia soli]|uniref:DUF1772 domain-containing protein n=1 Tax=Yinghuangia soli TaxID=2908204 RepID=A0AA41U7D9_9ACTN|nr:anthrone oxygenase family protein [Yinghuangia soli]MCF2531869.1 DUF1772 domain-containing protein [Yinghuangia soli]